MQIVVPSLQAIATFAGLPVVGAIAAHLWARHRNRLATVRWSAQYEALAFATHDVGWGTVEILYNKAPTNNLHFANVTIQNLSNRDLASVTVKMKADAGTIVLRSIAQLAESPDQLPFAPGYAGILQEAGRRSLTADELAIWQPRSDFVIAALNRGATVHARLLLARGDYRSPTVSLACDDLGIRLEEHAVEEETLGVRDSRALVVGLIATTGIAGAAVWLHWPPWVGVSTALVAGWAAILIGAAVVRAFRWVLALAD